jgi:hypothetical protein
MDIQKLQHYDDALQREDGRVLGVSVDGELEGDVHGLLPGVQPEEGGQLSCTHGRLNLQICR